MGKDAFRVKFWGTRGSIPVSGPEFIRYGGNTSCIELYCGDHRLIFDAGSGARQAGKALAAEGMKHVDLFFTHSHYDHIIGLPYFDPIFNPNVDITLWSGHLAGIMSTREMVSQFMRPPWFPVKYDICKAQLNFRDFRAGDTLEPQDGVTIRTAGLNHPGGCIGYRIEWRGRSVVLIYDTEHVPGELDPSVLELIDHADLVIYDCSYTEEEMSRFGGYGHSTWEQGVKLAQKAGARKLALFHHAPWRSDDEIDELDRVARLSFDGAFAAEDGFVLDIPTVKSR